jgi:hypothetical protein
MPSGGYLHADTASCTSAAVFTSGTITPAAPMSSTGLIKAGSLSGTRTSGVVSVPFVAMI